MAHILVIEDEPRLRALLCRLLGDAGYRVTAAENGTGGIRAALGDEYHLIVLDLMLPDVPGETVLQTLLTVRPDARVLILSSVAEVGRRVAVLERGAADFVPKPFVNAELLARVRLRLHREGPARTATASVAINASTWLDVRRREVAVDNARVQLSQREFGLLTHLMNRRGEVCTRQELLADVWGIGFDPGTNVVDVYVGRLRAKLDTDTIETVRNVGYRLAAC